MDDEEYGTGGTDRASRVESSASGSAPADHRYVIVERSLIADLYRKGVIGIELATPGESAEPSASGPTAGFEADADADPLHGVGLGVVPDVDSADGDGDGDVSTPRLHVSFNDEEYDLDGFFDIAEFCLRNPDHPLCRGIR